ncbi:MAG: D-2-hydroxyacid dehydrogenase [Deltaproteobacteria bacterium]|nr:D-2-hydroxyacid dehydrogenase [Deltaproteobacteria bacterium]
MARFLTNRNFLATHGERYRALCAHGGYDAEPITLPDDPTVRLDPAELTEIEIACCTDDFEADPSFTRRFLGSALRAPNLRWLQLPNAGIDHPVFGQLLAQGVTLTTASGVTAEPIAQTAIGGLLALARGFPRWEEARRRHQWLPHPSGQLPRDLRGQTMVIVGVGAIGNQIGRLAQALGLHVIGVRHRARTLADHVDEMHPPSALAALLPRADWLVLACPLTDRTRGLVGAAALALLPVGAYLINVARGQIIDEAALVAALQSGRLSGAYLDVFAVEPLPEDSPLWELPQVIISPHDSAAASGNAARIAELFLRNLRHWLQHEPLENAVAAPG